MNEQQLADLFSHQLDQLLQGQTPTLPAEASDLQELLDFGQQFSQVTFQPSPAAQAAFQGQLTSWFGPTPGGLATILGVPKTLLFTFIATAILVGTGAGLAVLGGLSLDNSDGLSVPEAPVLPTAAPQDTPKSPAFNTDIQDSGESEATEPKGQTTPAMTPRAPQSSLGETIPAGSTSSMGDTLPSSPSLGETLSLPTPIPTATAEADITEGDVGSGESTVTNDTGDTDDGGDGDTSGSDDSSQEGDHDKGHGNDADNIDEDNPGNSGNVLGGDTNGQGQSGGLGGLGRGNDNNGGGQGGQGGGGQGGGKGKGKGGGRGKSGN